MPGPVDNAIGLFNDLTSVHVFNVDDLGILPTNGKLYNKLEKNIPFQ
jgi:hypothetical protein